MFKKNQSKAVFTTLAILKSPIVYQLWSLLAHNSSSTESNYFFCILSLKIFKKDNNKNVLIVWIQNLERFANTAPG